MSASAVAAIGERLREARLRRGISVRGLARSVDVSASLISQIETGKSSPSVSTLYAITTALGISIEDVFGEPEADREDAAGRGGDARETEPAGGARSPAGAVPAADAGGRSAAQAGAAGTSPAGTSPAGTSPAGTSPGTNAAGTPATGTGADVTGSTADADADDAAANRPDDGAMIAALAGLAAGLATGSSPGSPVIPAARPTSGSQAEPAAGPSAVPVPVPDIAYAAGATADTGTSADTSADTGADTAAGVRSGPATAAGEGSAAGLGADRSGQSATAKGLRMLSQKRLVGPVVRGDEREVLHLDSGVTWELLGQLPDTHVDFLRITYAPGGSSSSGGMLMRHSGTEFGHVLSGRLTLTLGFENYDLGPGDSVCFDSSTPHAYANHGTEPAVGVWFVLERFR